VTAPQAASAGKQNLFFHNGSCYIGITIADYDMRSKDISSRDKSQPQNEIAEKIVGTGIAMRDRLKGFREKNGLTQAQMAGKLGIPQNTYSNYENAKREIPLELLAKMRTAYGIDLNWLLTGENLNLRVEPSQNEGLAELKAELEKCKAERDIYKKQYEDLLDRAVGVRPDAEVSKARHPLHESIENPKEGFRSRAGSRGHGSVKTPVPSNDTGGSH
jgi:transcriptional regulator with XRE-family HTH domain